MEQPRLSTEQSEEQSDRTMEQTSLSTEQADRTRLSTEQSEEQANRTMEQPRRSTEQPIEQPNRTVDQTRLNTDQSQTDQADNNAEQRGDTHECNTDQSAKPDSSSGRTVDQTRLNTDQLTVDQTRLNTGHSQTDQADNNAEERGDTLELHTDQPATPDSSSTTSANQPSDLPRKNELGSNPHAHAHTPKDADNSITLMRMYANNPTVRQDFKQMLEFLRLLLVDDVTHESLLKCLKQINFRMDAETADEVKELEALVNYAAACGFVDKASHFIVDLVKEKGLDGGKLCRMSLQKADESLEPHAQCVIVLDRMLMCLTCAANSEELSRRLCTEEFMERVVSSLNEARKEISDEDMETDNVAPKWLCLLHNCCRFSEISERARRLGAVPALVPYKSLPQTNHGALALIALCNTTTADELHLLQMDQTSIRYFVKEGMTSLESGVIGINNWEVEEVMKAFVKLADNHRNKLALAESDGFLKLFAGVMEKGRECNKELAVTIVSRIITRSSTIPLIARHPQLREALKGLQGSDNENIAHMVQAILKSMNGRYTEDGRPMLTELMNCVIPDVDSNDVSKTRILEVLTQLASETDFVTQIIDRGGVDLVCDWLQDKEKDVRRQALMTLVQLSECSQGRTAIKAHPDAVKIVKGLHGDETNDEDLNDIALRLLRRIDCMS